MEEAIVAAVLLVGGLWAGGWWVSKRAAAPAVPQVTEPVAPREPGERISGLESRKDRLERKIALGECLFSGCDCHARAPMPCLTVRRPSPDWLYQMLRVPPRQDWVLDTRGNNVPALCVQHSEVVRGWYDMILAEREIELVKAVNDQRDRLLRFESHGVYERLSPDPPVQQTEEKVKRTPKVTKIGS